MSCYVMNPDSICRIAYTLVDILNASIYGNTCAIATNAAEAADLHKAFSRYYSRLRGYNAAGIAEDLHALNCKAYDTRYKVTATEPYLFPLPAMPQTYTLYTLPAFECDGDSMREAPQEWHFHLLRLLDCYLYQTDEDATRADSMRKALEAFSAALAGEIVRHTAAYMTHKWGE